jgi:hypothetical protein
MPIIQLLVSWALNAFVNGASSCCLTATDSYIYRVRTSVMAKLVPWLASDRECWETVIQFGWARPPVPLPEHGKSRRP